MLCTVIYAHILNHNSPDIDTIQTWTCKYKNSKPLSQDLSIPSNMGNGLFKSICQESVCPFTYFIATPDSEQMLTIVTEICPLWHTCSVPLVEHVTCCYYRDLDRRQVGSEEVWEGMARPWCRDGHSHSISVKASYAF